MKILVVDDDFVSRKKMEIIMQNFGDCDTAKNGEDAVGIFKLACETGSPYEVIALDISMPDIDGFEVLTKIREIEDACGVDPGRRAKVIMVTAKSDKATVVECVQTGCNDYIVKPVNWKIVFNKLVKLKVLKFAQ